ncbi:MAG: DUF4159 domain-containing protein [Bacteroidetes bacterium]|nr:DUF4159 domain-containing protein [Bacteroidota bacterium]
MLYNVKKAVLLFFVFAEIFAQGRHGFQIARLKYGGGGDWYNDPSAEVNLLHFVKEQTGADVIAEYKFVDVSTNDLFSYPFLFITGHGNIIVSDEEVKRLRDYVDNGGFIYIDDDYGLRTSAQKVIAKIFQDKELVEIPFSHSIYNIVFEFPYGPPKTHEHDNKPPQGFGIFNGEKLALYFTVESNPSDGWADQRAHNDGEEKRIEALKFGANIVVYAMTN